MENLLIKPKRAKPNTIKEQLKTKALLEEERKGDDFYVGGTKILKSVKVSNGWVHVIGDVLVPSDN